MPLREVSASDHSRVARARRYREDVRVWTTADETGVLLLGRGLAGRLEVAFEVEPQARRSGLGRALVLAARHLAAVHSPGAPLWAQVSPANVPSVRALLSGGFAPVGAEALLVR